MNNIKKLCSLFLSVLFIFNIFTSSIMTVFAEETAAEKSANFINFYKDKDSISMEGLTTQDYYTLQVYMSNWFQPGVTTLKDVMEGTGFYDKFATSLNMSDNTHLKDLVKKSGTDIFNGLNSGECNLSFSGGKPIDGYAFVNAMSDVVSEDFSKLQSSSYSKIYYGIDGKNLAFDFSTNAIRAAFQTVLAYNPDLFLMKGGINSLDRMYIDAAGNVWGAKKSAFTQAIQDNGFNEYDKKGILTQGGAGSIYLILPACLNPSAFTPNATEQKDLRMPLMNRFVLSAMVSYDDLKNGDKVKYQDEYIPIYNALSYAPTDTVNSVLNVVGIHSLSPYTLNTKNISQNTWSANDRKWAFGNFLYNPKSFRVASSGSKNGKGLITTNSYIAFCMNLSSIKTSDGNGTGGQAIDAETGWFSWWWGGDKAFTVFTTLSDDNEIFKKQGKLLTYFFSPTLLSLNEVSMNFYKMEENTSENESLSDRYAKYLTTTSQNDWEFTVDNQYVDEDENGKLSVSGISETALASSEISKLGLSGMSLFLKDVSVELRTGADTNEENFYLVTPENIEYSKFVNDLINVQSSYDHVKEDYKSIIEGGFSDSKFLNFLFKEKFESGDSNIPSFEKFEESETSESEKVKKDSNHTYNSLYLKYMKKLQESFKELNSNSSIDIDGNLSTKLPYLNNDDTGRETINGYIKNNLTFDCSFTAEKDAAGNYSLPSGGDLVQLEVFIRKNSVTTFGNDGWINNVCVGRLLGFNDVYRTNLASMGESFTGSKDIIISSSGVVTDENTYDSYASSGTLKFSNVSEYILAVYGYSLFFPSETFKGVAVTGNESIKICGSDAVNKNSKITMKEFPTQYMMGIYLGYMVDMMGLGTVGEGSMTFGVFRSPFLPKYDISAKGGNLSLSGLVEGMSGVTTSEDMSFEEMQKDLIRRIYGLTNDSDNSYRNNLIKNIIEGFILTVHRTITGTWQSSISSVSTGDSSTYQSVTGYIYTPTLEELSFTSNLMNNYTKLYVGCMLIILFLLVLMVLLHIRTWQQGMLTFLVMSVALLFPYILISNTVNISNQISESIYSDRFDFWAMSEHFQSVVSLQGSEYMSDKDKWLAVGSATSDPSAYNQSGVKIKWMSPKKVTAFQEMYSDASLSQSFVTNMQIFKWLFASTIYDSEFVDTDVYGSYLYRRYNNIALEAQSYYKWGKTLEEKNNSLNNSASYSVKGDSYLIPNSLSKLLDYNSNKFIAGIGKIDDSFYTNGATNVKYSLEKMEDINTVSQFSRDGDIDRLKRADKIGLWGVSSEVIDVLKNIDADVSNTVNPGVVSNLPSQSLDNDAFKELSNDNDFKISKAIYLKNTESPFYYFYSVLRTRYGETSGSDTTFKASLLKNDMYKVKADAVLKSTGRSTTNAFRDFLDMEGLFTYVIPYLDESNNYVERWQAVNGTEIEEYNFSYEVDENGNPINVGKEKKNADGTITYDASAQYKEAVDRKNAMNRVWNMYSPWVDSLYSLNVMNQKVTVGHTRIYIEDTLNPSTYITAGRPMIFSEADMIVKGYSYKNLTDVERRIQAVTENTYNDLLYLVNYYDMDDEVLLCAAAMYATFNFNKEFSENRFLGESVVLYPQGFELRNFNYDAFMRLALLNSTGETVFATDDLYTRVLSKTSIFAGLLLLLCDLIACIAIPMVKFIVLIGLLFLGILICIACVVNPPEKIFESVNKILLVPSVLFMVLNIGFSWVISLVVGEGLTSYVGSKSINLSTNDPTITMLLMSITGIVYLFFCWKIMKMLFQSYKKYGMSTALAAIGVVGSAFAAGTKKLAKGAAKVTNGGVGAAIGAVTAGKGNRLAGMFEGASGGTKNIINQRIREKRHEKQLKESQMAGNEDLANRLNALSQNNGGGGGSTDNNTPEPPSELERGLQQATDKNANMLGRGLSKMAYLKNKVGHKIEMSNMKREIKRQTKEGKKLEFTERKLQGKGKTRMGQYINSAIETMKYDNAYYGMNREMIMEEKGAELTAVQKKNKDTQNRIDVCY